MKKIIAVLLLLTLVAGMLFSCGKNQPAESDHTQGTQGAQNEPATTPGSETGDGEYQPDDDLTELDFEEKVIRILTCTGFNDYEFIADSRAEGKVEKAVFDRNNLVESDINVCFEYKTCDANDRDYAPLKSEVVASVNGGGDEFAYHIVANPAYYATSMIQEGWFKDISSIEDNYISIDKKYWVENYVSASTINGKYYFLVGELCTSVINRMEVMFVNNRLLADYRLLEGTDGLFDMVYNKQWTYEKMLEMIAETGNGEETGVWGLTMPCNSFSIDGFLCSMELDLVKRNENGNFSANVNTQHNMSLIETLRNLYYKNPGVLVSSNNLPEFQANTALFGVTLLSNAGTFYDAKISYSIIPLPMWNADQGDYYVTTHDSYTSLSIPKNVTSDAAVTAALESLAYRSHDTTYAATYETTYRLRYSETAEDAMMFDYIFDHLTYSTGMIYSYILGELKNTPRYLLYPSTNTWVANCNDSIVGKLQPLHEQLGSVYIDQLMTSFQ